LNELATRLTAGEQVELPDGLVARLTDPFIGRDGEPTKAWKPCGVGRWALKITPA
jgi:hypothetical protein